MNTAWVGTSALSVRDVSFQHGDNAALVNLSFSVKPGEFLAILGPNGAGKSTLMALLTRLLTPASGSITVFSQALEGKASSVMRKLGVVYQQLTLDLDLSVQQNLQYHGALQGLSPGKVKAGIDQQLQRFELADVRHRRIRQLNGGHRRRVELARALLHSPALLLLDEPTVGLDLKSRKQLNQYVRALCRETGTAVVWTTHLVDELDTNDHLLLLHRGQGLAFGSAQALLHQHRTPTIADLLERLTEAPCH